MNRDTKLPVPKTGSSVVTEWIVAWVWNKLVDAEWDGERLFKNRYHDRYKDKSILVVFWNTPHAKGTNIPIVLEIAELLKCETPEQLQEYFELEVALQRVQQRVHDCYA